jgi:glycosidase
MRLMIALSALAASLGAPALAQEPVDYTPRPAVEVSHPDWAVNAAIYQINTRQFTEEGTFVAAAEQLPRLAEMGVDIIWLMPVHPIGEVERKGTLGSPYSVRDYYGVNPEFGTLEDLRAFIDAAHGLDMHVILDWVANHSAWDNPLVEQHPDWYSRDWRGEMQAVPGTDWSDVVDFDFSSPELREYMTDVMAWWVEDVGVDGFRADVAGFVPLDFWETLRARLDAIKPVFMLAEWETRDHSRRAFDATYAWSWNNTLHDVAMGNADAGALRGYYFYDQDNAWPQDAWRLTYVSNHDQNAWVATQFGRFGEALESAIALSVVGEGMPMVYNGQEAGNTQMLEFFERDPIAWRDHALNDHFTALFGLLEANAALWHGAAGGQMVPVETDRPAEILSFVRSKGEDAVFAAFNFSADPVSVVLQDGPFEGGWTQFSDGRSVELAPGAEMALPAWGHAILVRGGGAPAAQSGDR